MKNFFAGAAICLTVSIAFIAPSKADSCYDLWYKRNAIYAENGYCFKTKLGRLTFGNEGCFTRNPNLSKFEARDVKEIREEEKRRGCKVN